jgi:hypothetical protein
MFLLFRFGVDRIVFRLSLSTARGHTVHRHLKLLSVIVAEKIVITVGAHWLVRFGCAFVDFSGAAAATAEGQQWLSLCLLVIIAALKTAEEVRRDPGVFAEIKRSSYETPLSKLENAKESTERRRSVFSQPSRF